MEAWCVPPPPPPSTSRHSSASPACSLAAWPRAASSALWVGVPGGGVVRRRAARATLGGRVARPVPFRVRQRSAVTHRDAPPVLPLDQRSVSARSHHAHVPISHSDGRSCLSKGELYNPLSFNVNSSSFGRRHCSSRSSGPRGRCSSRCSGSSGDPVSGSAQIRPSAERCLRCPSGGAGPCRRAASERSDEALSRRLWHRVEGSRAPPPRRLRSPSVRAPEAHPAARHPGPRDAGHRRGPGGRGSGRRRRLPRALADRRGVNPRLCPVVV